MRIWMDPDKLLGLGLTSGDVITAVGAQNAQVAAGRIGALPNPIDQQLSATVLVKGQLGTPDEFGAIILRANTDKLDCSAARRSVDRGSRGTLPLLNPP